MPDRYRIDTQLGQIAVHDSKADGPPVLLIHGNSSCKEVFSEQLSSELASQYRLIAIDLPGHGQSDDIADCASHANLPALAQLVAELIHTLNLHRPVVLGWSLGGHIGLEMLAQGMNLKGLILSGATPAGPGVNELRHAMKSSLAVALAGKETFTETGLHIYLRHLYGDTASERDDLKAALHRTQAKAHHYLLSTFTEADTSHSQKQVIIDNECPIAVLHGEKDPFLLREYFDSLTWKNRWKDQTIIINQAGHAPFLEQPKQFNVLFERFLIDVHHSGTKQS